MLPGDYAFGYPVFTEGFDQGVCLTPRILGEEREGHSLPIEIVSAIVLREAVRMAESKLAPRRVRRAVITVPAYFSERQRVATMMAAQMAGLKVIQFLAEPTAAAVAYFGSHPDAMSGHDVGDKGPMKVLVVDFGGGTFDVSAIEYARGHFTVKAVDGDLDLGGRDIDTAIVGKLLQIFKAKTGKEIVSSSPKGRKALARLRAQAEAAKQALSTQLSHTIAIDNLYEEEDLVWTLSRATFEELARPIVERAGPYIAQRGGEGRLTWCCWRAARAVSRCLRRSRPR
jgi:molecular chaperone DnaK (HSP70)